MDFARRPLFYIYSGLIFLPAVYRIYFPAPIGDYAYYVFAFLVPVIAILLALTLGRIKTTTMLALLAILILLIGSGLLASSNELGMLMLFHGFKIYIIPVLMFIVGYNLGQVVSRTAFIRLLLAILVAHFIFSLLYYYDVLANPMYDVFSQRYSENWVVTVGEFKAFIGLTLSKFGLAYQVGFMLVGLILTRKYFRTNSLAHFICVILGVILVVFTYNKTIMVVVILTVAVWTYQLVRGRSRFWAYLWISMIATLTILVAISFLTMEINLTGIYRFLSPTTFWSRVISWEAAFHFDFSNLWRGLGAGYFDLNKIVMDSQYLYTYLELGLLGAIMYFSLLAYIMYQYSPKNKLAKTYIALLFLVFIGGDMLGALSVIYVAGLFFGQLVRSKKSESDSLGAYENRC